MGSGTFRGGIHPYDGKELSRDRAIQDIRPGKELAYLVSQHIGDVYKRQGKDRLWFIHPDTSAQIE